jgi:hypothetical protein
MRDFDPNDEQICPAGKRVSKYAGSPADSLALYLHFFVSALKSMERVKGIEPS